MRTKRVKRVARIVFALWLVFVITLGIGAADLDFGSFISITDIHFNPFADQTLVNDLINADYQEWEGIFRSSKEQTVNKRFDETNFILLQSVLGELIKASPNPDFIIMAGDFLAHDFAELFNQFSSDEDELHRFIYNTISFVTLQIKNYYPKVQILLTLGNNDSYSGDYSVIPDGAFLHDTFDLFYNSALGGESEHKVFEKTYTMGGYYATQVAGLKNAEIIVLNSILFSSKFPYQYSAETDPGLAQLTWFESELQKCAQDGTKVWVVLHIPPGVDVYSSLKAKDSVLFWKAEYNQKFITIVNQYASIIQAGFAGHTHMDDLRMIIEQDNEELAAFFHITPAITPVFGNNPGFQVFTFDKSEFTLMNYQTYYFNLQEYLEKQQASIQWVEEYDFLETYYLPYSEKYLVNVYDKMDTNTSSRSDYIQYYSVDINPSEIVDNWKAYLYGIQHLTSDGFDSFFNSQQ